jgi:predicted ATPase
LADGARFRGSALVQQGQVEEGITQIELGIRTGRGSGFEMGRTGDLAGLALAYAKVGQVEKALTLVADALALVDRTEERVREAGLYVLQGWFLLSRSRENRTEAEACFRQALEVARRQSAKPFELHAVMGLARLWQKQGKKEEARKLLGESYGWFTEGFETKDLQEAKALLDSLGSSVYTRR